MGEIKNKIFISVLVSIISLVSMNPATAAGKLQIYGASSTSAGKDYTFSVQTSPKKAGLAVSAYALTVGSTKFIKTIKTNRNGLAKFKFTSLSKNMTIEARATGFSTKRLKVKVLAETKISINWPDTQDSDTCSQMYAKITLSPKTSGRKVTSQFKNNSGSWVSEYDAYTNSNGVAFVKIGESTSGGTYLIRVIVQETSKYSSASKSATFNFIACEGNISGSFEDSTISLDNYQSLNVGWTTSNWIASSWVSESAAIYLEICDPYYDYCDVSDPSMPLVHEDSVVTYRNNDYGIFTWYPDEYGTYVVRLSIWDDNVMLDYVSGEISVN